MHAYDDTEAAVVSERLNNFPVKILLLWYDKIIHTKEIYTTEKIYKKQRLKTSKIQIFFLKK